MTAKSAVGVYLPTVYQLVSARACMLWHCVFVGLQSRARRWVQRRILSSRTCSTRRALRPPGHFSQPIFMSALCRGATAKRACKTRLAATSAEHLFLHSFEKVRQLLARRGGMTAEHFYKLFFPLLCFQLNVQTPLVDVLGDFLASWLHTTTERTYCVVAIVFCLLCVFIDCVRARDDQTG